MMKQLFKVGRRARRHISGIVIGVIVSLGAGKLPAQAQDVVIGAQFSLSGPRAAYAGPNLRAAAELAVERVNATQMLGDGRKLKLILDDNAGEKTQAIALVNKQAMSDRVLAIVGPQGSDLGLPVASVANDLKIPLVAIGGSNAIVEAGPWSFIGMAPANAMTTESVSLVDKLKLKSVAVVFDRTNDSSARMKNSFEAGLKARGVTVTTTESITPQDTNFGPLATKLANTEIDAIYIEAPPAVQANLAIQLKQAGLNPKVKILLSPNADSPQLLKVGGTAVNDVYFPTPFFLGSEEAESKRFVEAYRGRTGNDPDMLAALGYNSVMLVASAIKMAGPDVDRDKIRIALGTLRDLPSVVGTGRFSIGKERLPEFPQVMLQIVDGKFVRVPLN